jgi:hypothetical protein
MSASGVDDESQSGAGEPGSGEPDGLHRVDGSDELDELDRPVRVEPVAPIRRTPNRKGAAMLAAGMFAIDDLLRKKPREEAPIVVDANGQPVDIDTEGIQVSVESSDGGEVSVAAPALPRSRPVTSARPARRRRG